MLGYDRMCWDVLGYSRMCLDELGYARMYLDASFRINQDMPGCVRMQTRIFHDMIKDGFT